MLVPRPFSVNPGWTPALLSFGLAWLALLSPTPAGASGCGKTVAEPIVHMELIAPLMAHMGPALKLTVGTDGCVVAERPAYYARSGKFAFRLDVAELNSLRSELAAVGPGRFDTAAVKLELASKRSAKNDVGDALYAVADGNLLRIRIRDKEGNEVAIGWRNLDQDLLNFADFEPLLWLAAARDRLLDLGNDPRLEAQP